MHLKTAPRIPKEKRTRGKKHAKSKNSSKTRHPSKFHSKTNINAKQQDKITKIIILITFSIVALKLILSNFIYSAKQSQSYYNSVPDTLYLTKNDNSYAVLQNKQIESLVSHTGPPGIASLTPEIAKKTLPGALNPYRANSFIKFDIADGSQKLDYGFSLANRSDSSEENGDEMEFDRMKSGVEITDFQQDQVTIESGKNASWKKKRLKVHVEN